MTARKLFMGTTKIKQIYLINIFVAFTYVKLVCDLQQINGIGDPSQ